MRLCVGLSMRMTVNQITWGGRVSVSTSRVAFGGWWWAPLVDFVSVYQAKSSCSVRFSVRFYFSTPSLPLLYQAIDQDRSNEIREVSPFLRGVLERGCTVSTRAC